MDKRNPAYTWIYAVVLLVAFGVFGVGVYLAARNHGYAMLAAGSASLIAVLVAWPLAMILERSFAAARKAQEEFHNLTADRLQQLSVMLNTVSEQQLLSDRAKAVAFREKDRDALRRAIREEMGKQDWEAAMSLANDMAAEFGYMQEAERFREEINNSRQEIIRKQITEVTAVMDRHCRAELWSDALREAERLLRIFPDNMQVRALPQEIEARKQLHKRQLMDAWSEAVGRKDVDGGIEILKKLDAYLTPTEAEGMQENVRSIFRAKMDSLRAQFSAAVQDHNWNEAVRLGENIIRDFPNARAAQEVRDKMDTLRQRAANISQPMPAGI